MPAYDNTAVAAKLELYADLLEISGADKYRFLSYKKAANSIRAWQEQVATLANEGRLTEVPGVGQKMAGIIDSIITTGTFADLETLSETVPPGLAKVMRIPGVGPKRAALLHDKLGVESVEDLESELAQGRVERLGGFGSKTAEKIAQSLESHRLRLERRPIADVLPMAEQLVRDISALPSVARVELAGSVRRRAETVGNIDLVVETADEERAAEELTTLAAVERVLEGLDEHRLAIELHDETAVAIYLASREEFGEVLRYFTGSAEHNDAIEAHGVSLGLAVGPRRIQRDGEAVETPEERDVFALLGVTEIPPEAREGVETLAMAAAGELPDLITLDDVRGDLQSHSTYTDGKTSLEANREMATELGYEYFAATDHAYALRMVGGLEVSEVKRQLAEIDEMNSDGSGSARILKGIELNIAEDGSLDYDDELLARFEIVLASLHSGWDQDEATVTKRMLAAIEHPLVDVIAHPTGRILGRRDPMRLDMRAVLEAAGETGTVMEINSYPDRLDLSAEHIKLARSLGVRFSLGTDAHAAIHMRFMPYGVAQARRGLVTREELLNAQPWETARTWLKRARVLG